ncbi:MAG: hypothetical protein PHH98_04135 [Candidatus Gracilibacteria bacterium]|nr:hypothetical protein [Candidatus Gracilibacteria bacterium]
MPEINIDKIVNTSMIENREGEKDSLINDIKKANFFIDYFRKNQDSKYSEVKGLYDNLTLELNNAISDNKIETKKELEGLKQSLNIETEYEKIINITRKLDSIFENNTKISTETLERLSNDKLDNDSKKKIFFEIRNNLPLISHIKDPEIIKSFFEFYEGTNLSEYYKHLSNSIINFPLITNSYIKNTSQINMNLIPDEYFTYKIEGHDNISDITKILINGNQNKIESRVRSLFLRLNGNIGNIKLVLNVLLNNEKTKLIIENNLPKELIENKETIQFLKENGIVIQKENIENPSKKFNELSKQILDLSINQKDYDLLVNKYIDELDSFIIRNGEYDKELLAKIINKNYSKFERFSCINYNKEIAKDLVEIDHSIFMNLSTELRKDEKLIKASIKNQDDYAWAYFINIDSIDTLINSYKILMDIGINSNDILNFPNFSNAIKSYANKDNIWAYNSKGDIGGGNILKELENKGKNQDKFFSESLKDNKLILNDIVKNDFFTIINSEIKNETKSREFLDILYKNKEFDIDTFKENYNKLLLLCSGNEKILKNIFNYLLDKQAEVYNNPEILKKITKSSIENSNFEIGKIKIILNENSKIREFLNIEINNDKEEINLNTNLLNSNFKDFSKNHPTKNKNEIINLYLSEIGLSDDLSYDEGKLRELLGGILLINFEKIKSKTIANQKETAYDYISGKITREEYNKIIDKSYNENLKKEGLPSNKNEEEKVEDNKNGEKISNVNNIENYDSNSGIITLNGINGVEKINLNQEEQDQIKNNPEIKDKIINFYSTLKDLGIDNLWIHRENIFKVISNKKGIGFDAKTDYLGENEIIIFLNSILKSVGMEEIPLGFNLENVKNKFMQLNNKQVLGNGYGDNLLQKGSSKISEIFIKKYVNGKISFDNEGFSKNI